MNLKQLWEWLMEVGSTDGQDNFRILKESAVFRGLPAYHYPQLEELLHESRYESGERIFTEGDPSSALYIIKEGQVEIFQGQDEEQETVLRTLGKGELLGELALCLNARRTASARTVDETLLMSIFRQELQEFALREPRCGVQIMRNLLSLVGERLMETNRRLQDHLGRR